MWATVNDNFQTEKPSPLVPRQPPRGRVNGVGETCEDTNAQAEGEVRSVSSGSGLKSKMVHRIAWNRVLMNKLTAQPRHGSFRISLALLACGLFVTVAQTRAVWADEPPQAESTDPVAASVAADDEGSDQDQPDEPNKSDEPNKPDESDDAAVTRRKLAPFLAAAETALKRFDSEIEGYTCLLIKRERIKDALSEHQYLWMKVREPRREGEQLTTPQSVYIRYLKPSHLAGREILYVENERNGKVLARKGGRRLPNLTMPIRPDSTLAMAQSRQPISKAGIRSLLEELVQSMRAELVDSDCVLNEYKSAKMNGRPCRHFEVRQQIRKPGLDYQLARVLLDEELRLPVYFASYAWADQPGDDPVLQEEYMFTRLTLNPKLTDQDFHRDNPEYKFSEEDDEEPQGGLKEQLEDPNASKDL